MADEQQQSQPQPKPQQSQQNYPLNGPFPVLRPSEPAIKSGTPDKDKLLK